MPSALMLFPTPVGFYTSHPSLPSHSEALMDLSTLYPPSCFISLPMTAYHLTHFSIQLETLKDRYSSCSLPQYLEQHRDLGAQ